MLNEHKSLLRLDEQLRSLKSPDNTTRDKKKKIQALEELTQGRMTELKKHQEVLRKGLENMAKGKEVNNKEIVGQMDVNTTQLDSATIKELINTIKMSQRKAVVVLKVLARVLTTAIAIHRKAVMLLKVLIRVLTPARVTQRNSNLVPTPLTSLTPLTPLMMKGSTVLVGSA